MQEAPVNMVSRHLARCPGLRLSVLLILRTRRLSAPRAQEDKYKEHGFDLRQFERLKRDVRRYERYLRRASDQHVSVFPDPEAAQGAGDTSVTLAP